MRKHVKPEAVNHPAHYGGADNPYEVIKVIDAWKLNFNLGNCVKCIARADKKLTTPMLEDLRKGVWYLQHEIETLEKREKAVWKTYRQLLRKRRTR